MKHRRSLEIPEKIDVFYCVCYDIVEGLQDRSFITRNILKNGYNMAVVACYLFLTKYSTQFHSFSNFNIVVQY